MKNKNHVPQPTRYVPVIGLETHVELKTKSKMFCGCSADYFGKEPNTHTCPVCLGLPGALPVPNKRAIEWCIKIALSLNCEINELSKFDRKNYFYPDLAKGYQISQYDLPFGHNGFIDINSSTPNALRATRRIRITRVHMEEDTGKLIHEGNVSLVDFNRSGVPLVEIVTEPDFDNATDVKEYLQKLQQIVRYLDVSNADMEKGEMRLEPNISLARSGERMARSQNNEPRATSHLPPYKVEVKNINSFRFVEQAINFEIKRQSEILEKGEIPAQETRGYDSVKQKTFAQRSKEEAHDYRYFPEPDIPPIRFTKEQLEILRKSLPELQDSKLSRFIKEYMLPSYDAEILTRENSLADYFEECVRICHSELVSESKTITPKHIANWLIHKKINIEEVLPATLIKQILSASQTVQVDEKELEEVIKKVLQENPQAVTDYKKGKENAMMFLLGQVMRKIDKKINTQIVKEKLKIKLK